MATQDTCMYCSWIRLFLRSSRCIFVPLASDMRHPCYSCVRRTIQMAWGWLCYVVSTTGLDVCALWAHMSNLRLVQGRRVLLQIRRRASCVSRAIPKASYQLHASHPGRSFARCGSPRCISFACCSSVNVSFLTVAPHIPGGILISIPEPTGA